MSVAHQNDFLHPGNRPQIPRIQIYTHNFLKSITQLSSLLPNKPAPTQIMQQSNLTPALKIQQANSMYSIIGSMYSIIHAVCLLKRTHWGGHLFKKASVPGTVSAQKLFKNKTCLNTSLVKRGRLCVCVLCGMCVVQVCICIHIYVYYGIWISIPNIKIILTCSTHRKYRCF